MLLHHQQESEARAHEERVHARDQEWEFEWLNVTTRPCEVELELIKERDLYPVSPAVSTDTFDVVYILRLLPTFCEKDVGNFFGLFERLSQACQWTDVEKMLSLQCGLTEA